MFPRTYSTHYTLYRRFASSGKLKGSERVQSHDDKRMGWVSYSPYRPKCTCVEVAACPTRLTSETGQSSRQIRYGTISKLSCN